jgi:FAD:protein FMN transferase
MNHELAKLLDWFGLSDELPPELALYRFTRRAMATQFEIFLPFSMPGAHTLASTAFDAIDAVEDLLTVYRDDSAVADVNARAGREAVNVDSELFELLQRCQALWKTTGGCFDVATGAMTKAWGFFRREGAVPGAAERIAAMNAGGMGRVILDERSQQVKFRRPGLELNFGAIGKGYALDQAVAVLRQAGALSALVHGGSSSVRAVGCPAGQPRGWPISLKHPWEPTLPLGTIWLEDAALGTSAATFQYFEHQGEKLGHILDPRRGWPARGVAMATVIAADAATADALSTALFVMGVPAAREFGRTHPEISAVLLADDQDAVPVTINLPCDRARFVPGTA